MNLISHFYLDREHPESLYFVGIATPDLVSVFDRKTRLKAANLPIIMENESSREQMSFYNGILRHFEVDALFHSSEFFQTETQLLARQLKDTFGDKQVKRSFFVAHILLELILDRILILKDSELLYSFYKHFQNKDILKLVYFTEWACKKPLPGYAAFLWKFAEKKFLYNYTEWEFLVKVIENLLKKVGIQHNTYLHDVRFIQQLEIYQEGLTERYPTALRTLSSKLMEIPY